MLIYLASPYTHSNRNVEDRRAKAITIIAGMLIKQGNHIFCPIAHCHKMNRLCNLGGRFEYWREFDEKMISACGELWIVVIVGWQDSIGISAEIRMAAARNMTIRFVNPLTLEVTRDPFNEVFSLAAVLDHWKHHDPRPL